MRHSSGFLIPLAIFLAVATGAPAAAQEATESRVAAAGASFPASMAGEGAPVLFVHGSFSDLRAWDPVRDAVAADHRFIAYTQRHFGTSGWPEEPAFSRDVHVADLVALLETWGEPMSLVGWSSSGPIVLQAAMNRPDLVQSVVIFEPALETVLEEKPEHKQMLGDWVAGWVPTADALAAGDAGTATRLGLEYVFGLPAGGFETLPDDVRTMFLENAPAVARDFAAPLPKPMTCDDLGGVDAPVLILYGSATLPFFDAAAREVAACLPAATLEEMPGVGHGGPIEDSEGFAARTLAFIDAQEN